MSNSLKENFAKTSVSWTAPVLLVLMLWAHGATLGLTDDEAYYWVLAQKPSLGYAFHPPAVAWIIAAFQWCLGWLLGSSSAALVRLPSSLMAGVILGVSLRWVEKARGSRVVAADAWTIVGLAGVFGAAWMMVPDLPLFCGWALAFLGTWCLCFESSGVETKNDQGSATRLLFFGVLIAVLSKFSGVVIAGCAGLALLVWSPKRVWQRSWGWIILASAIGLLPTLIWNAQNHWAPILYQFHERQSGGFSLLRYARFWAIELILAGPAVLIFAAMLFRDSRDRTTRFVLVWVIPHALVYCLQPLWAEFKPHWALIVWLPLACLLAFRRVEFPRLAFSHRVYGVSFALIAAVFCHFSLIAVDNPNVDVSNDLYGWRLLPQYFSQLPVLPVIGSRYQTASQAAASLHGVLPVTMLPRDGKQLHEWSDLGVSDSQGPDWPKLTRPVYFVADNRYSTGPGFKGATCQSLPPMTAFRSGHVAKRISVWRCDP